MQTATSVAVIASEAERRPIVNIIDGEAIADSRDVAAFFEKAHRDVLRAIDILLSQEPDLGLRNFAQGSYQLPSTGDQTHRHYRITRDGFMLLAMGFTGGKALRFKMAYIAAFNAMEAELQARPIADPVALLNDPVALRGLLLASADREIALRGKVDEMQPKVAALDRIAVSEGSFCITDAAKTLQVGPKALFRYLQSHAWIYQRPNGSTWLAYQTHLVNGDLEHKTTSVLRGDGSEKTATQVRVTPQGLTKLAKLLSPAVREVV